MDIKEYKVGMLNEKNQSIYDDGILKYIVAEIKANGDVVLLNEFKYDTEAKANKACEYLNKLLKRSKKEEEDDFLTLWMEQRTKIIQKKLELFAIICDYTVDILIVKRKTMPYPTAREICNRLGLKFNNNKRDIWTYITEDILIINVAKIKEDVK